MTPSPYPRVPACGPKNAKIMIVGEAPGESEVRQGLPFVGESGKELTKMLHEAGIARNECFITNVCKHRPPGNDIEAFFLDKKLTVSGPELAAGMVELQLEIAEVNPNIIIALGDTALWALTGQRGITSWRGSVMETLGKVKLLPTYHPAAVLRMWDWRNIAVHDLRRAKKESEYAGVVYPAWNFHYPTEISDVFHHLDAILDKLDLGPMRLAVDIETIRHEIACVGFATSPLDAVCIPIRTSREYWTLEEELAVVLRIRRILTHKNARIGNQNYLYDAQYFARKWGIVSNCTDDSMFMQHVLFAGMPKDLAFIASLYCEFYQYWKDDLKDYRKAPEDDLKFFRYNCLDVCYTFEAMDVLEQLLHKTNLYDVYRFQMRVWHNAFRMMLRGVKIDKRARDKLAEELMAASAMRKAFITHVVGYDLNPKSPKQMHNFLYNELRLPQVKNRKTGKATANFDALKKLSEKEPLLLPVADALLEQRSIGVFLNTFVLAELDEDGKLRCSYNPAGTETFRLSSSENAFGTGTNLQNIPKGDRKKTKFELPNIRKLFIPSPGCTFFDVDLDRADLQVVVWEADDAELKRVLRDGIDMHCYSACSIYNIPGIPMDELAQSHPNYPEHRGRITEKRRNLAKAGVHAVDYACQARTLATTLGITVREAENFIRGWLGAHPGIARWHSRIEHLLMTTRTVTNKFGYRRYYFGRVEELLSEALAWIPQSTVAIVINRGWDNVEANVPEVAVRLQVHDSLAGEYPTHLEPLVLPKLHSNLIIPVPYPDELIIPVGLKTSTKSWGDCKDKEWPHAA